MSSGRRTAYPLTVESRTQSFLLEDGVDSSAESGLDVLTDARVADRLGKLTADPAAWTPAHEHSQFSLAGAQVKIGLR
jgi:hypothetical protein